MEIMIIVIVIVGGLIFFASRKRSQANQVIEITAAQVSGVLRAFNDDGRQELPEKLFDDPYMVGFLFTLISLTVNHAAPNLSTESKGNYLVAITQRTFPSRWEQMVLNFNSLVRVPNAEFLAGSDNAGDVVGLLLRKLKPEHMASPEVQAALENASKASLDGHSTYEGAAALLMAEYVLAHKSREYPDLA